MSNQDQPLVSIGMPVYNEEKYIRASIEALLAQDYENIEIILSDNASNDNTSSICKELADANSNITFHQFNVNVGITRNFNHVLENSSGEYFMWASGHDLWSTNYITECVKIMINNPQAVISFGSSQWIDQDSQIMQSRQFGWADTRGLDVFSRYIYAFWGNMHPILGVIKKEKLLEKPAINTAGTDMIILCRLSLEGDFTHATHAEWSRREFRDETTYKEKLKRYKSKEFGLIASKLDLIFPLARLPIELTKDIFSSKHTFLIKLSLFILIIFMLPIRFIAGKLVNKRN